MREENNKNALEVSFAVRLYHQQMEAMNRITELLQGLALMNPTLTVSRNWSPVRHGWLFGMHDSAKPLCLQFLLYESILNDPVYAKEIVLHTFFNFKWAMEERGYITHA